MARCQQHQKSFLHFKVSANQKTDRLDPFENSKDYCKANENFPDYIKDIQIHQSIER